MICEDMDEICLYLSGIKRSFNDSSTKEYLTLVLILKLYFRNMCWYVLT